MANSSPLDDLLTAPANSFLWLAISVVRLPKNTTANDSWGKSTQAVGTATHRCFKNSVRRFWVFRVQWRIRPRVLLEWPSSY